MGFRFHWKNKRIADFESERGLTLSKSKYTQVNFRLTEKEKEEWQEQANNLNMTLPKFTKHIMNGFFQFGYIKQPKINKQQGAEIAKHLGRLGGNVNQFAKWCNTHKEDVSDEQAKRLADNLEIVQKELKKAWQQLISTYYKM